MPPSLAIIIATLNAADTLPACLAALAVPCGLLSVTRYVADGGSGDQTRALAQAAGCTVIETGTGRATQFHHAALQAIADRADYLWFLHADTIVDPTWPEAIRAFIARPDGMRIAGYGRLRFDDGAWQARFIARLAGWRARAGLPYGDQGLLMAASYYQDCGGYPIVPFLEDVLLVRRIGVGHLVELRIVTTTSAARYRRDGWFRRSLWNLVIIGLFIAGASPRTLKRLYGLSPRR